jgi:hypothetical protein
MRPTSSLGARRRPGESLSLPLKRALILVLFFLAQGLYFGNGFAKIE